MLPRAPAREPPDRGAAANGHDQRFRHDAACALRIGGRDCWFALPYNSACSAFHGLSIRLTQPANYAPPTANPSTRLKLRATAVGSRTRE